LTSERELASALPYAESLVVSVLCRFLSFEEWKGFHLEDRFSLSAEVELEGIAESKSL
jgi:hypothetical protein